MKGFIAGTTRLLCLWSGVLGLVGCSHYRDLADPCWFERYNSMASQEVKEALAPQVQNGRVLDQTVWDSYFETGTSKLTAQGIEHLNYLVRRRPCPDTNVFLQTAQVVPTDAAAGEKPLVYNPDHPEDLIAARNRLNQRRKEVVERYLVAATNGRNVNFNVEMVDVSSPKYSAIQENTVQRMKVLTTPAGNIQFTNTTRPQPQIFGTSAGWQ